MLLATFGANLFGNILTGKGTNIKKSYKNSKFKISALTWNKEFELPDGL